MSSNNMEAKNVKKERKPLNVNNQGKSTSYSTLQFLCNICKSGISPNLNTLWCSNKPWHIYVYIHILFFNTECNLMTFPTKNVKFRYTLALNRNFWKIFHQVNVKNIELFVSKKLLVLAEIAKIGSYPWS